MKIYEPHKSSIGGMDANNMALLCYVATIVLSFIPGVKYGAWVLPLIFFFMEKDSALVKFHAIQAFTLYLISAIISIILDIISFNIAISVNPFTYGFGLFGGAFIIGAIIATIIGILFLIFSIIAMMKAYKYEEYSMPVIGKISEKFASKLNKTAQ